MENLSLPLASKEKHIHTIILAVILYDHKIWKKINHRELRRICEPRRTEVCGG
jgi:hypothetical protein